MQAPEHDLDTEVCYGALFNAQAKTCGSEDIRKHTASQAAKVFSTFALVKRSRETFHMLSEQIKIAILDVQTTSKLVALRHIPGVRYEALVENRAASKRKSRPPPFEVSVNIFGPRSSSVEISRALSQVHAFLQHPHALNPDVDYYNPDILCYPGQKNTMNEFIGASIPVHLDGKSKVFNHVESILESLSQATEVFEMGQLSDAPNGLSSTLTLHQKKGVFFFLQREDEKFCENLSYNISKITGINPSMGVDGTLPGLGGLIADVMGLGKTLTTLASILQSASQAQDFTISGHPGSHVALGVILTKATLIVVPSIQLVENWESEIANHFEENSLRSIRFHGTSRPQALEALTAPDIVLTTYATLVAEHDGLDRLRSMEWYRVVLDEAHEIRNPRSKQWKATVKLRTRRRWCLSGTPIQNKMEDLAALAGFLQLRPIGSIPTFERHILRPLSEPGTDSKPLRAYMEAYCLRRSESCLSLPASRVEVVPLHLSPPERLIYDEVLGLARKQNEDLVSSEKQVRRMRLFTSLIRMRMICNTGTFESLRTSKDSLETHSHLKQSDVLLNQCHRCSGSDEDIHMLLSACEVCPDCMLPLHQRSPSPMSAISPKFEEVAVGTSSGNEFSTKLDAVVKNVLGARGPESKAIIFSFWKDTLHLLAHLLRKSGVLCLQVDGDTSFADRSHRLRDFKTDPNVHVLLMTVGTGAVGLNLTVANQVHVVEPQWNPSVEEQAVARVFRMGQNREVIIYKYVLQNTVEQNVVALQEKKRKLASYTLRSGSEESISDAVEELENVLGLNPRKRGLDDM